MIYVSFIWCKKAIFIILLIAIRKPLCPYNILLFYVENTKLYFFFSSSPLLFSVCDMTIIIEVPDLIPGYTLEFFLEV